MVIAIIFQSQNNFEKKVTLQISNFISVNELIFLSYGVMLIMSVFYAFLYCLLHYK